MDSKVRIYEKLNDASKFTKSIDEDLKSDLNYDPNDPVVAETINGYEWKHLPNLALRPRKCQTL